MRHGRPPVEVGQHAESAVTDYLFARGFTILERNLRLGHLEVDVVARREELVVLVEVRTRGPGSLERAFESVSRTKRMRLLRAAERLWRQRLSKVPGVERVRIDVAAVTFDGSGGVQVEYVEGAISG